MSGYEFPQAKALLAAAASGPAAAGPASSTAAAPVAEVKEEVKEEEEAVDMGWLFDEDDEYGEEWWAKYRYHLISISRTFLTTPNTLQLRTIWRWNNLNSNFQLWINIIEVHNENMN